MGKSVEFYLSKGYDRKMAEYFASGRKRITKVVPRNDFTLVLSFDNGKIRLYDARPLLQAGTVFAPFREWDNFRRVYLDEGHSVCWDIDPNIDSNEVWNNKVDLCPDSCYVETVVLLSKGEVDSKKIRVEFSLEDMDMSEFQDGATYPQIKEYVLEHTGLKVSNLYISQIKRKCGIGVGKNYNLPKSEDSRQPQCPQEKEKAIREAFKYFGMI
mgnify:FL=1